MTTSRRDVLRAGASLAVLPIGARLAALSADDNFEFTFFSDTHVGLKNNIPENRAMFEEMRSLPFAFGINGGDVTDYGWVGEYRNYRELLKLLPFPVRHVPGNHDVRWSPLGPKAYKQGTQSPMFESFDHRGCHFILLDSTIPLSHYGHFESEMLRWMKSDLSKISRETPLFIVTHHWVGRDGIMVDNEESMLRLIEPYNVKILLNAHGHSDLLWTWNGIQNTMNRGLYQLSYERIEVDRKANEVRMSRRTKEKPQQELLVTVPLKAPTTRNQLWSVPAVLSPEKTLHPFGHEEYRWDDNKWQPLTEFGISGSNLVDGTHRLSLRTKHEYVTAGRTNLTSDHAKLKERWRAQLSGGVMSHLLLHESQLFVSTMDGSLAVFEADRGRPIWHEKLGDYAHSSPVVSGNVVVVGSADGFVHARDRRTGKPRWKFKTEGPVYASGTIAKGVVSIASGDGCIYGIDLETGDRRWKYSLPSGNSAFIQSQATNDGTRAFFGAWDSHLYALDILSGELVFRAGCCADRSFAYSPAIGGPVVANGNVYVPANGNVLYCFNAENGNEVWQAKSPGDKFGYSAPTFTNGLVVAGNLGDKGEVRAVDAKTAEIKWTATTGSVIYDSSPVSNGSLLAIGSVSGLLNLIEVISGKIVAQHQLPVGHFLSSPAIDKNRVYTATYNDLLIAFDLPLGSLGE